MYDDNGVPYGFEYITDTSSNTYYYTYNAQGDVMGILNSTGFCMYNYVYDPWGKLVTIVDDGGYTVSAGSLAHINPIRYRGYFYDAETGFYYLNSRYYDPVVSRFISPDVQINADQGPLGMNIYAYCLNNPINRVDVSGNKSYENEWAEVFTQEGDTLTVEHWERDELLYSYAFINKPGVKVEKVHITVGDKHHLYTIKNGVVCYELADNPPGGKLREATLLGEAIYNSMKTINPNYLLGRTAGGVASEISLHRFGYKYYGFFTPLNELSFGLIKLDQFIYDKCKTIEIGGTKKDMLDYDYNALAFEVYAFIFRR